MKTYQLTIFLLFFSITSLAQDTIKVMQYNLLFYGNCQGAAIANKDTWLKNITEEVKPDIFAVVEMTDNIAYANRIKQKCLTWGNMEYTAFTNTTGSSLVNMLFYNKDKFGYAGIQRIGGSVRDINVYKLYHKTSIQGGDTTWLHCMVAHLKAGTSDRAARQNAALSVMNWISAQPSNFKNYLFMGDFNIYSAGESAWQTFMNGIAGTKLYDPSGFKNGWGSSTPGILSQAPTNSRSDCGSGGGLDDRFDFILTSDAIINGTNGISYVANSYETIGNDGRTPFNGELNCSGNTSVPSSVCANLKQMSDHLPIVVKLNFPFATGIKNQFPIAGAKIWSTQEQDLLNIYVDFSQQIKGTLKLECMDAQGQVVLQKNLYAPQGRVNVKVQKKLSPGLYIFRLQNKFGKQILHKALVR